MPKTTCIIAIQKASPFTSTNAVDKLYLDKNIEQPEYVDVKPIKQWRMSMEISALDVLVNASMYATRPSKIVYDTANDCYDVLCDINQDKDIDVPAFYRKETGVL